MCIFPLIPHLAGIAGLDRTLAAAQEPASLDEIKYDETLVLLFKDYAKASRVCACAVIHVLGDSSSEKWYVASLLHPRSLAPSTENALFSSPPNPEVPCPMAQGLGLLLLGDLRREKGNTALNFQKDGSPAPRS